MVSCSVFLDVSHCTSMVKKNGECAVMRNVSIGLDFQHKTSKHTASEK